MIFQLSGQSFYLFLIFSTFSFSKEKKLQVTTNNIQQLSLKAFINNLNDPTEVEITNKKLLIVEEKRRNWRTF